MALVDEFKLQVAGAKGHRLADALGDDAHFKPPSRASVIAAPSCALKPLASIHRGGGDGVAALACLFGDL